MTTTSTNRRVLGALSNEERWQRAQGRLNAVNSRTSTVAAQQFFAETDGSSNDWKTLPERINRLCQAFEGWVRFGLVIVVSSSVAFMWP
jgi:hypothetical protein